MVRVDESAVTEPSTPAGEVEKRSRKARLKIPA